MTTPDRLTQALDSDELRERERWFAAWLPPALNALEEEWDRAAAANAVKNWTEAEVVGASRRLVGAIDEYFRRAGDRLGWIGRRVRLSSPLPIVYAVDFELWREQWAVRSAEPLPAWGREVLRQHCNTLRIYLRLDPIIGELNRRLRAEEMDLLRGCLFNRSEEYHRTVKRLRKAKGSHPDDSKSRREEKDGTIRVRLATILKEAETEPVPTISAERLDQLQLDADVLRNLEHATSIALHQRPTEESWLDRRDTGFLLRTLDGRHRYLQGEIKDDLAEARKRTRAQKRRATGLRSLDEGLTADGTEASLPTELVRALAESAEIDRDIVDRLLNIEQRAVALAPEQLTLLRRIFETGITDTTNLADLVGVSRQTCTDARRA